MRWFRMLVARLRFNRTFSRHPGTLEVLDDGLALQQYRFRDSRMVLENQWSFAWSDVRAIHAYKVDLVTIDQIRFVFSLEAESVVVSEDMAGFDSLIKVLPRQFPGFVETWFATVAFPSFQQNWTTLWSREPIEPDQLNPKHHKNLQN